MNRFKAQIGVVLILACAAMACVTAASAKAGTVQDRTLFANGTVQTWTSRTDKLTEEVRVYAGGKELEQRWVNSCKANYVGNGLLVTVRVKYCGRPGAATPYEVRYVSVNGMQAVRVVVTAV